MSWLIKLCRKWWMGGPKEITQILVLIMITQFIVEYINDEQ